MRGRGWRDRLGGRGWRGVGRVGLRLLVRFPAGGEVVVIVRVIVVVVGKDSL